MAPFRNRDRSNRSGRAHGEHNVLEGLPINQYREVEITVGPNLVENKLVDKDAWPEPPMPRDFHMLPEHSQHILRIARSPRTYNAPVQQEEDKDPLDEEDEHKEVPQGFTVKKWVKIPRHLEDPEPEYLAKRRKGLPSQYAVNNQSLVPVAPLRETKVQKTDAEGNVNVYKVLVPEGQAVAGEIRDPVAVVEVAPTPIVPGTVVEGVGVANADGVVIAHDALQQTPNRRKPPPPKKKKKSGPGRGKKKVVFAEGGAEQGIPADGTNGHSLAMPGVKQAGSADPSEGDDTPMRDVGDDEEGSGEEGSEEDEQEDGSQSPLPAIVTTEEPNLPEPISATDIEPGMDVDIKQPATTLDSMPVEEPIPLVEAMSVPSQPEESVPQPVDPLRPQPDLPSSPDMPLSTMAHSRQNSSNETLVITTLEPAVTAPVNPTESALPVEIPVAAPEDSQPILETTTLAPAASDIVASIVPAPVTELVDPESGIVDDKILEVEVPADTVDATAPDDSVSVLPVEELPHQEEIEMPTPVVTRAEDAPQDTPAADAPELPASAEPASVTLPTAEDVPKTEEQAPTQTNTA